MMKHLFAVLLALPLLAAGCAPQISQNTGPQPLKMDSSFPGDANAYIAPLKSSLDGRTISINLVRLGEHFNGTFQSTAGTELVNGGVMGSPTGTNQIELNFYIQPTWDDFASFTGSWNNGQLIGTWHTADGVESALTFTFDNQPGMTPLDVRFVEATEKDASNIERCYFSMAYPVVTGKGSVGNTMNSELEKAFGLESPSGTRQTVDEKKRNYFESCLPEITDQLKMMEEEGEVEQSFAYSDDTSFTIELNEKDILSLSAEGYFYSGGAHGLPWITGVNLDAKTGKTLSLSDVIRPDKLQEVHRMIAVRALAEFNESLFDLSTVEFEKIAAGESENPAGKEFLISRSGITIFWNVYEISPYVAGQPQVFLSYDDISEYINLDGPLGRLLNK